MNPTGSFVRNQKNLKIKRRIKKLFSYRGCFYTKTPKSVYNSWYNSKGHNAGMLMGGNEIGVGLSYGIRDDGIMFCVATMLIK